MGDEDGDGVGNGVKGNRAVRVVVGPAAVERTPFRPSLLYRVGRDFQTDGSIAPAFLGSARLSSGKARTMRLP
jgi:hypothetical protein